jgi:hypothetical protein
MAAFTAPDYIERSKIAGRPLDFEWGPNQFNFGHGFNAYGERSSIVRKLEEISCRGILGLLAACAEWLVYRLAGPDDQLGVDLANALWVGSVDPRLVNLSSGIAGISKADPAKGPIRRYAWVVRSCYEITLEDGFVECSYAESALRLVDYVMPNASYRNWRRACYGRLAQLSAGHDMEDTHRMLNNRAQAAGTPYETKVVKQMLADGELDELWGPALPREAFDPKATPAAATSNELLTTFLANARIDANPFLQPAAPPAA